MPKQNDESVSIAVRFIITGRPDDMNVLAAKWLRENRDKAIEFLAEGKKSEILAAEGYPSQSISWAKVESAAFHSFRASALSAQLAAANFHHGEGAASYHPPVTAKESVERSPASPLPLEQPKQLLELSEDNDDDFDDNDDDEMIVGVPTGYKE